MRNLLSVLMFMTFAIICFAEIPNMISYQGRLTHEGTGEPVVGTHDITFRAYAGEASDSMLWEETHSVTLDSSAIYKVELGSTTPFPASMDFTDQYWLEITIDGTVTLSPRYRLTPSPYSMRSKVANTAALANTALSAVIADSANMIRWANIADMPAGFADGSDDGGPTLTTDISSPLEISGDTIRVRPRSITGDMISPMGALDGEAILYDTAESTWTPGSITGGISGGGYSGGIPIWASSDSLATSPIYVDSISNIGISTTSPDYKLTVYSSVGHNGIHIHASQPSLKFSNFYEDKWEFSHGALSNRLTLYSFDAENYVMAIDTSGNVGIGYSEPDEKLAVNGNIRAGGDIYKNAYTAAATPIAFGYVNSDASFTNCTENVSVVWNPLSHRYEITIAGESYVYYDYVTVITLASPGGDAIYAKTNSVGGDLLVYLYNSTGVEVQDDFHFVVYKP